MRWAGVEMGDGIGLSDVYSHIFVRSLLEGKKFGAACRAADQEGRRRAAMDGESIIQGKRLTQATPAMISEAFLLVQIEKQMESEKE